MGSWGRGGEELESSNSDLAAARRGTRAGLLPAPPCHAHGGHTGCRLGFVCNRKERGERERAGELKCMQRDRLGLRPFRNVYFRVKKIAF